MLVRKPALRLCFFPFTQRNVLPFWGFFKVRMGERSVRIREVKGSNPSRSTNLPHRFVRCGVFYVQKTLADRAGLRTLKSDANRVGSSMCFLKIHRFYASFFTFCMVLRARASLLCPFLGNFFKDFRAIVG